MRLLPKQIGKEEFHYYSDKSVDELKFEIQELLEKTKGWNFSVNLMGEFISENEFKMMPKWQFAVIKGFENEVSYLNGQIFSDELNRTRVTFTVRPNSIVPIFFFAFPLIGVFILASDNIKGAVNEAVTVGAVFTFVVPIAMLLFGSIAKHEIKNRFIRTFDLKPVSNFQISKQKDGK